tara:strand:- start:294 stop:656 length:363 start_codon:yes stop_codon:yes gene_type:complete
MATYTKVALSEGTNGLGVQITSTSNSSPTTIHNAPSGTTSWDEIWLWVVNNDALNDDEAFTINWGDANYSKWTVEETISVGSGLKLVVPGLILQNSQSLFGWASVDNTALTVFGYVNRIT